MTNHTPVDRFAIEAGDLLPTPRAPSLDFEDPLRRFVLDWCITQGIAEPALASWQESVRSGSNLSQRGRQLCLELDINAATLSDVHRELYQRPALLLRIIDWLVRAAYARLQRAANSPAPFQVVLAGQVKAYREGRARPVRREIDDLEELLASGNSAWTVDPTVRGLAQRLSDEEQATFEAATEVDDPATDYLREGWAAAWGLNPDGGKAYDRAIKALEAAFRREVTPNHEGASLGEISRDLCAKPGKWSARLSDARPPSDDRRRPDAGVRLLAKSLGIVFSANHRHAGTDEHVENTLNDGRDAVTLAVALIAMQRRGFLERVEEQGQAHSEP